MKIMSIQDWGAVGELVGAFAVIVSIIYLAHQIRGNTKIARSQSTRELLNTHSFFQPTAQDADLTRIVRAGLDHFSELPRDEQVRFNSWLHPLGNQVEACFRMHGQGLLEEAPWIGFRDAWIAFITTQGGADWWNLSQHLYGKDFAGEINAYLSTDHGIVPWTSFLPYYGWDQP
jgi:hypothetical protein